MSNAGKGGDVSTPMGIELAAYDSLPPEIRAFVRDRAIPISAHQARQRLVYYFRGDAQAWMDEAVVLFPQVEKNVARAAWGPDHPGVS